MKQWFLLSTLFLLTIAACSGGSSGEISDLDDKDNQSSSYSWTLPKGFPVPVVPKDNLMSEAKVLLGRYLFYDKRLSGNSSQSCASCHHQDKAFSDGLAVSFGSTGAPHPRNALTLTNVAYNSTLTWANPSLVEIEFHTLVPLFSEFPVEMGVTGAEDLVLQRLQAEERYILLFKNAFPENPKITFDNIVKAISAFIRTLISGESAYDRWLHGDSTALSNAALRGMDLFFSERFECHHCHGGFNFTSSTTHENSTFLEKPFHNTGLYNIDGKGAYPSDNTGLFEITNVPSDMGKFRAPTLRNIQLTAPYMHDGSITTLEEVIDFYSAGGRVIESGVNAGDGRRNPFKSGFVSGFSITEQEKMDLITFLESLTDWEFVQNPKFSDPFLQSSP
jgi:cytochrome c peroxidase